MKPTLLVNAPIETRSGYGARARDLVRAIIKLDRYDVFIKSTNWGTTPSIDVPDLQPYILPSRSFFKPNVLLSIDIPTNLSRIPADFKILCTAGLEANRISPGWIEDINTSNLTIVSSQFSKEVFQKTIYRDERGGEFKVQVPVEVLLEGVDTNVYKPQNFTSKKVRDELARIPEKFLFLYTGHFIPRKNVAQLVNLFTAAFRMSSNPPALVLKTSTAGYSYQDIDNLLKHIEGIQSQYSGKVPNVYIIYGDMTDAEMNELYNHERVKVHISATHGEGYGRPLAEASQSSKPLIVPDWSGHLDFCNENTIKLPGQLAEIPHFGLPTEYTGEGSRAWFEVNAVALVNAMRDVHANYDTHLKNASAHQQYVKQNFSMAKMEERLVQLLDTYVPKQFKTVELPWRGL